MGNTSRDWIFAYKILDVLHSVVLHFPVQLQAVDLREQILALALEQLLVVDSCYLIDVVGLHGRVDSIANELDTGTEIS